MRLSPYAKAVAAFIVGLVGAAATTVQAAISDDVITGNEWTKIGFVVATWLVSTGAVFQVPNRGTAEEAARMSVIGPGPSAPTTVDPTLPARER
jgi:hypothetical protein